MFRIYDGRFEFYQWDLDRKILVADPAITEVHFCNKTDSCSLVVEVYELGGNRVANVPNILLQENWDIRVYGYCGDCYTRASARFKVVGRTKPADYVYTETEVRTLDYLEGRLDEIEAMAKGAVGGKSFMDYAALVETLNAASNKDFAQAQHMLIKTLNVPDVWVYEVKEESVPYEYVDDDTFAQGVTDGLIQIGYYVLSALETGKVDLTDYVKFTDYATNTKAGVASFLETRGIGVNASGGAYISPASKEQIKAKSTPYKPISPTVLDYAWKVGATTNTEEWTDEEKAAACETIGAAPLPKVGSENGSFTIVTTAGKPKTVNVAYSNYPKTNSVPVYNENKTIMLNAPVLDTDAANKKYVDDNFVAKFTNPENNANRRYVLYSYQNGTQDVIQYSSSAKEFAIAQFTSGGNLVVATPRDGTHATTKGYVDDNFVAKMEGTPDSGATRGFVYGLNSDGTTPDLYKIQIQANANTIPLRNPNGSFYVGTPTLQYEAVNKGYVDDLIANLQAQIDALKGV